MGNLDRRDFVKTVAAVSGFSLLEGVLPAAMAEASAHTNISIRALADEHKPKPLPFDASKLTGLSERLMTSHWENNYQGSVKTLNAVRKKLAEALSQSDTPAYVYGDLKREHLMRTGSVVNHELYFGNLGGNGKIAGNIQKSITSDFGSVEVWEGEFKKIAQSLAGGSGWVMLGWNMHLGILENYWLWDHLHGPSATVPILVMDMYEHSYHIDYGAQAAKYIDAFFQNINWEEAERRLGKVRKIKW
jgi:superoxide dismutase, Fe-Mn family